MNKGLIIASFGTTVTETRRKTISMIERSIEEAFPGLYSIRAFTSRIIKKRLKDRDDFFVCNEQEAYDQVMDRCIPPDEVYIQPLHIIPGYEYEKLTKLGLGKVGHPLFTRREDLEAFARGMDFDLADDEALILFGHGTDHVNDRVYHELQEVFFDQGKKNVFIVCVEGNVPLSLVEDKLKALKPSKVILQPLMIVAGVHAMEDMDSDDPDCLRAVLEGKGFKVESRFKGLGEYALIHRFFVDKTRGLLEGTLPSEGTYIVD